ncbi:MAG TPA: hypothetical protein DEW35_03635 [Ruminococcaceae bacterium]|nr:hypothetical protein [Oscillospiraceae bacterium]
MFFGRCVSSPAEFFLAEHNRRLRKYYRITDSGLKKIEAFKTDRQEIIPICKFVTGEDKND